MKKALLVVSFGTTHHDTLDKTIAAIEADLAGAFPERDMYRAFTSSFIIKRLKERDGISVDSVSDALDALCRAGYDDVLIQPSHIICGDEYSKLRNQAQPYREKLKVLYIGNPLLSCDEDYFSVAQALIGSLPQKDQGKAIVVMGHGSEHLANASYCQMQYVFDDSGREDIHLGCVEGYPELEQVIARLKKQEKVTKLLLIPFMIVAGDHAKNDLAGQDDDSWASCLGRLGYEIECSLRGLGECSSIRQIFVEHAKVAKAL